MDGATEDWPEPRAAADVALITRGITVTASVDVSDGGVLVVQPVLDHLSLDTAVKPGDLVELYWPGTVEERTLPARVSQIEGSGDVYWHLTPTGPATKSQRRRTVRADVALPVAFPWAGGRVTGRTQDLSEAGLRARVDGWGLPPEPGQVVAVEVTLDEATNDVAVVRGEILRLQDRADQWVLSVHFLDLREQDEDRLRRRVFTALRESRAAAAED